MLFVLKYSCEFAIMKIISFSSRTITYIFQVMSLSHIHSTSELYKDETDWVSSMWETLTVSRDKFNVTKIDLNCMTTGGKNKINIRKSKNCKNRNHEWQKDINIMMKEKINWIFYLKKWWNVLIPFYRRTDKCVVCEFSAVQKWSN